MGTNGFAKIALVATVLALCVVVLGAYVRLSDAGLGCPDWPGCYGKITVPEEELHIEAANQAYPDRPVEAHKAWKEMIHRYFAGVLGLLVLSLAVIAFRNRKQANQQVFLPLALLGIILFQALLGMWTVTLLLKPLVVMAHLLGGLTTLSLLWWLTLKENQLRQTTAYHHTNVTDPALQKWAVIGLVVLVLQIALGGWTSSNYAALICTDFPACRAGQWWPEMDFKDAFILWRGLGVNYEFGVLDHPARTAIHMSHRFGALITFLLLLWVGIRTMVATAHSRLRWIAWILLAVLFIQVLLGILNVLLSLPLFIAVAHNGVAALLLLVLVTLNFYLHKAPTAID